jgi:hypothetical protein
LFHALQLLTRRFLLCVQVFCLLIVLYFGVWLGLIRLRFFGAPYGNPLYFFFP